MKKSVFILITILLSTFCYAQSDPSINTSSKRTPKYIADSSALFPFKFISRLEAEKILGRPAHLKDSLRKEVNGYLRFEFSYITNSKDTINYITNSKDTLKRTFGSLMFWLERSQQTALAKRSYDILKNEAVKNLTYTELSGIGEEGFTTKDPFKDPLIIIRKENKIFKLRAIYVTGIAAETVDEQLKLIAKKIVSTH